MDILIAVQPCCCTLDPKSATSLPLDICCIILDQGRIGEAPRVVEKVLPIFSQHSTDRNLRAFAERNRRAAICKSDCSDEATFFLVHQIINPTNRNNGFRVRQIIQECSPAHSLLESRQMLTWTLYSRVSTGNKLKMTLGLPVYVYYILGERAVEYIARNKY